MPSLHQPAGQSPLGLTASQVRARIQAGQVNTPPESPTKSVKRIVLENLFSFFNLIFFIIAGFLIAVGSFGELIFLLVVSVLSLFLPLGGLDRIVCLIGIALFLGITAYDSQKIGQYYVAYQGDSAMLQRASIFSALQLYLDFINLFLYLLRFFARNRSN